MKKTKSIVRKVICADQNKKNRFSRIIAALALGSFNLKGQEIEQVMGVLIYDYLKEQGVSKPKVIIPQKKKGADLSFEYEGLRTVDLKFYGGAKRVQLSTLDSILPWIRSTFGKHVPGKLNKNDKSKLIEKISALEFDYTLVIFSTIGRDRKVHNFVFDFDSLNLDLLKDFDFELKRVAAERRVEIHVKFQNESSSTLEISAGGNPYNRGIWLNKISKSNDLNALYKLNFFENILEDQLQKPEFDPQQYIRFKGKSILKFVENEFYAKTLK